MDFIDPKHKDGNLFFSFWRAHKNADHVLNCIFVLFQILSDGLFEFDISSVFADFVGAITEVVFVYGEHHLLALSGAGTWFLRLFLIADLILGPLFS